MRTELRLETHFRMHHYFPPPYYLLIAPWSSKNQFSLPQRCFAVFQLMRFSVRSLSRGKIKHLVQRPINDRVTHRIEACNCYVQRALYFALPLAGISIAALTITIAASLWKKNKIKKHWHPGYFRPRAGVELAREFGCNHFLQETMCSEFNEERWNRKGVNKH